MIDIKKILEIVDRGQEVFIARDDKPIVVVLPVEKYEALKNSVNIDKTPINSQIAVDDDYVSRVRKSLID